MKDSRKREQIWFCKLRIGYLKNKAFHTDEIEVSCIGSDEDEIAADKYGLNKKGGARVSGLVNFDILNVTKLHSMGLTSW